MDFEDIGSALKRIDDLDSELYSGKGDSKSTTKITESSAVPSDGSHDNLDGNDDNFSDLLYDDDDDDETYLKKAKFLKSPKKDTPVLASPQKAKETKNSPSKKPSVNIKKVFQLDSSPERSPEHLRTDKKSVLKTQSPKKSVEDLSDLSKSEKQKLNRSLTFESESDLPSPTKSSKNKIDLFLEEETKYLEDLDIDELENNKVMPVTKSSSKKMDSPKKILSKKVDDNGLSDNEDISDPLDTHVKTSSPRKGKSSFIDDLFGDSPKESKKTSKESKGFSFVLEEKYKKKEKEVKPEEFFGDYAPSSIQSANTRRRSVKFEDEVPPRPSTSDSVLPRRSQVQSPKKDDVFQPSTSEKKNVDDDDDWLGLLRKGSKAEQTKSPVKKSSSKENASAEHNIGGRRSSGAEWLGLSFDESPKMSPIKSPKSATPTHQSLENDELNVNELNKRKTTHLPWLSDKPSSASISDSKEVQSVTPKKPPSVTFKKLTDTSIVQNQTAVKTVEVPGNNTAAHNVAIPSSQPANIHQNFAVMQDAIPFTSSSSQGPPSVITPYSQAPPPSVIMAPHAVPSTSISRSENVDFLALQTMLTSIQFEKEQLQRTIEVMKQKNEENFKMFQNTVDDQKKVMEETYERKLKHVKEEHESELRNVKRQLDALEDERKRLAADSHTKIESIEKDYHQQIQKLKDLHNEAISVMKRDHEEALERLRKLKDQEIEAISSNEVQARTMKSLSNQLESTAAELALLQAKVDEKHQVALQEKQAVMQAKERELKALEGRLRWQMEDGEQERSRLQQLVLRLESRLQQQTKEGEEDRWEVQQRKTKLEVHQKFLEEEKITHLEIMHKEKERLRQSQETLLYEQKNMMMQLGKERQQLIAEKLELESLAKRIRDEESRLNTRKIKEESMLESQRYSIHHEEEKLRTEKESIRQHMQELQIEKQVIEREKRELKDERDKVEDMKSLLKRRSEETEELAVRAAADKDEAKAHLFAARKIESDHHARMNQFTKQMQAIMEKEKELLKEKEKLNHYRKELEEQKNAILCANCKIAVGLPMTGLPPIFSQIRQNPTVIPTVPTLPTHLTSDPNLMVWYLSAQKDREYLQNELSFLQSLKDMRKGEEK